MDKYDVEYRMYSLKKFFAKFLMNSSRMIQEMIFGSDVCVKPQSAV